MSVQNVQKAELLRKTADYYRRSIADYKQFAQTERKPMMKKQLERQFEAILQEIDCLKLVQLPSLSSVFTRGRSPSSLRKADGATKSKSDQPARRCRMTVE
jgi:hypothetical protein